MVNESKSYVVLNGEQVSPDAMKARMEPPAKKSRRAWWLRLILRHPILIYVLVVGGIGGVLSSSWKPLEKHFPKLNEFIHSDVSDQDDLNYQLYKLKESERTYKKAIAICNAPKTSLATCQSAFLSAEPALISIGSRISKLNNAWQAEVSGKTMPDVCKQRGTREYKALGEYVIQEQRVMAVMKGVDPKSPASVVAMNKQLQAIAPDEAAAVTVVTSFPPWPKECAEF